MSTELNSQEVLNKIYAKCWEDEAFKADLIADPAATLEKFTGSPVSIPKGMKLIVNDQTQDSSVVYINIPAEPNLEDLELTDEQLEAVAGGATPAAYIISAIISYVAAN